MGAFNSKHETETIHWGDIKTEQVSDIPNLYNVSADANKLVERLNIQKPQMSESDTSDNFNKLFAGNNQVTNVESSESFSSTSPFISSDLYKHVMNKYKKQNMIGGAKDNELGDDSDTSSTSSSESLSSSVSSVSSDKKKHNKVAKNKVTKKSTKVNKKNKKGTEAFLDYVSSSAHTGGSLTESSVLNENTISVSSVRTSQINLVSE